MTMPTARPETRVARRIALPLAILALAWATAILAAPRLAAGGGRIGTVGAAVVYVAGSGVCHQRPDRSFATAGVRWPVCGRCTGLYLGAALGVLVGARALGGTRALTPSAWRVALVVAALPTAMSWLVESLGGPATPIAWRAVLGAWAGCVVGAFLADRAAARPGSTHDL
jgi:uncharacterized membrane protein